MVLNKQLKVVYILLNNDVISSKFSFAKELYLYNENEILNVKSFVRLEKTVYFLLNEKKKMYHLLTLVSTILITGLAIWFWI